MATTTTNYGFDVPTSTDLVKNGATQIALLGQDLDTFLFRPFTRNGVINSSFQVWQRGISISNFGFFTLYTADRWNFLSVNSGRTISRQLTNDTTNLPFIQYCARVQRDSGNTDTTYMQFANGFETINTIPFKGKTITFSFYARKGANYSQSADKLRARIITGTGTDQNVNVGYTGAVDLLDFDATLTSTWQRFQGTVSVPTTVNEMATAFTAYPTGTAGANDWFEVTGVQLEVGNQASPYAPAGSNYQAELAMCQRYYFRTAQTANNGIVGTNGIIYATTSSLFGVKTPITLRSIPTSVEWSSLNIFDGISSFTPSAINLWSGASTTDYCGILVTGATGMVLYRPTLLLTNSTGYLAFSAEL
jgi:hypothetical protein